MLILMYVHDSLRWDFVGCYNPNEANTPHLDRLAREAVIFERAYAQTTWTKGSGASILTSIYPQGLGMDDQRSKAPAEAFHMLRALREAGYVSLALSTNSFISERFGFEAGFDEIPDLFELSQFKDRPRRPSPAGRHSRENGGRPYITSRDLNGLFLSKLEHNPGRIFFLLWSMDTHLPYFDRDRLSEYDEGLLVITKRRIPETPKGTLTKLYRGMAQYADRHFGELVDQLKQLGLYEDSLIMVLGDHGESFGEHGQFAHAGVPYAEQIHVPLVIKFPAGEFAGSRRSELVELVDLLPTVLEIAGVPLPGDRINGRSLIPILRGEQSGRPWAYSSINSTSERMGIAALITSDWHYLHFDISESKTDFSKVAGVRSFLRWCRDKLLRPLLLSDRKLMSARADGRPLRLLPVLPHRRMQALRFAGQLRERMRSNLEIRSSWKEPRQEAQLDDRVKSRLADLGYFEE